MNRFHFFALMLLASLVGSRAEAQTLLTYWNFNNESTAFNSGTGAIGSLNTTAASYGETFTAATNRLSANTGNSAVFSSSGIYLDLTNMASGFGTAPIVNGIVSSSRATTSSSNGGFGAFADTPLNRVGSDSSTGGSLFLMDPNNIAVTHSITLSLSSSGYEDMVLTYANRLTNASTLTETWSYSTDGTSFTNFGTQPTMTQNANFYVATLNMSAISAIENQASFFLRMTIGGGAAAGGAGSLAIDNLQLTGLAVVPEPSTWMLVMVGLIGVVGIMRNRRQRALRT